MRNSNGTKLLVVGALIVSVIALSIGFAAFTTSLNISSSAEVSPSSSNFNVSLSTTSNSATTGSVAATGTGATGANATLTATRISGLKATFTAPGQSVKYSFYAYNGGSFLAYLNSVVIGSKTCTAVEGTNQSYVDSACNGISISVKANEATFSSSNTNIADHTVAKNASEPIEVTISYASGSAVADGDFTVAFGDVVLTYGSAD